MLLPLSASRIAEFLSTFVAADPNSTAACARMINNTALSPAEHSQDVFVWHNLFARLALHGRKGFYVDSGANQAFVGSNTWFFDRCLGWPGLCVEPMKKYHDAIRRQRSCTLVPACVGVTDNYETTMNRAGPLSHIDAGPNGVKTTCFTLRTLLQRHAGFPTEGTTPVVDFWSLDIEGHEMSILESDSWLQGVHVRALLVEDNKLDIGRCDARVTSCGYSIFARFLSETLYVSNTSLSDHAAERHSTGRQLWCPSERMRHSSAFTRHMTPKARLAVRDKLLACPRNPH